MCAGQRQNYFQKLKNKLMETEQQQKIAAYVAKVKALDEQKAALTAQFKASEQQLSQVNNKSNKTVYGQAAQYKTKLGTCKFKLICYFNKDKKGQFYSFNDKEFKRNRRQIPSIDFINSIGGQGRTDHENAYNTLLDYCFQNTANLDKAILILNDYMNEEELTIFIYNPTNIQASQSVQPRFKDFKGGRYFDALDGNALRIDKMRFYE